MTICDLILLPLSSDLRHLKKRREWRRREERGQRWEQKKGEGEEIFIFFVNIFIIGSSHMFSHVITLIIVFI